PTPPHRRQPAHHLPDRTHTLTSPAAPTTGGLSLGFEVVADHDVTPGVGRIRQEERARGLDRWARVVMRRDLPA
ncbi:MAG: hypothetical protein M0Z42_19940, partial [Actinomycetota bacterium]|nr:hypothetical protein [Actinomycetota bacterium]